MKEKLTSSNIYSFIDKTDTITNEIVGIFKEMDELPSVTTQASLNNMLVTLSKRIKNNEDLVLESTGEKLDKCSFDEWVQNTFGEYSAKMYMNSVQ